MSYIVKRKKELKNGRTATYLEEVESVRENGKVKQKFIRYIGKKPNRGEIGGLSR